MMGIYDAPPTTPLSPYIPDWKPAPSVTLTQSYSQVIKDGIFNILSADPYFAGYTCRKTKMLPVMPNLLPYLGVYFVKETQVPNGDANCTDIKFNHTLTLGFSIIVANNDQDAAEQTPPRRPDDRSVRERREDVPLLIQRFLNEVPTVDVHIVTQAERDDDER